MDADKLKKYLEQIPNNVSGDGATYAKKIKQFLRMFCIDTNEQIEQGSVGGAQQVTGIKLEEINATDANGMPQNNIKVTFNSSGVTDYASAQIWYKDQQDDVFRQAGSADGVLETLFRTAAACGKTARSGGRISGVPTSVAHRAVEVLREQMGELAGKSALVIGNGEMGRLSASLLREAGCQVTVTLRSYHHGQTVVPAGCEVVPYEARYEAMEGMDLLLSATTSPHYTVNLAAFAALARPPRMLVDLAIPRDIQPELAQQAGVTLLNVDHLRRQDVVDANAMKRVQAAVEEYLERFLQWNTYRESLPAQEELKQALRQRMRAYLEAGMDAEEAMELTVEKTVELIAGGLNDTLPAHAIRECAARIRQHTRA